MACYYFVALAVMMLACLYSCMESQPIIYEWRRVASYRLNLVLPTAVVPTMKIV